jgi:hypothetical protein
MSSLLFTLVYLVLILGLFFWLFFQRKKRREGRFPIGEDIKALRRPGEHLSQELARLKDQFEFQFLTLLGLPLLGLFLPPLLVKIAGASAAHAGVLVADLALVGAGIALMIPRVLRTTDRIRDYRLGLYGERLVADQLAELIPDGYAVFHDVPCLGSRGAFNLDHVVVGNGHVIVVETKTRRKPKHVEGESHKVRFDGKSLVWPDHSSTGELEQVRRSLKWLQQELKKERDLHVEVKGVLTMPGWYVTEGCLDPQVSVTNAKMLPGVIRQRYSHGPLTEAEEKHVRLYLRDLCTNVDFPSMPE